MINALLLNIDGSESLRRLMRTLSSASISNWRIAGRLISLTTSGMLLYRKIRKARCTQRGRARLRLNHKPGLFSSALFSHSLSFSESARFYR